METSNFNQLYYYESPTTAGNLNNVGYLFTSNPHKFREEFADMIKVNSQSLLISKDEIKPQFVNITNLNVTEQSSIYSWGLRFGYIDKIGDIYKSTDKFINLLGWEVVKGNPFMPLAYIYYNNFPTITGIIISTENEDGYTVGVIFKTRLGQFNKYNSIVDYIIKTQVDIEQSLESSTEISRLNKIKLSRGELVNFSISDSCVLYGTKVSTNRSVKVAIGLYNLYILTDSSVITISLKNKTKREIEQLLIKYNAKLLLPIVKYMFLK